VVHSEVLPFNDVSHVVEGSAHVSHTAALEDGCSPAQMQKHHGLAEAHFEWISDHLNHRKRLTKAPIIASYFADMEVLHPIPMSSLTSI
jgi:hypothetical protein